MNKALWIVATVVWALAILPTGFMAVMTPFMFDAPGSDQSPYTWALFWCVLVLPVFCLLGAVVPWFFRKSRVGTWLFLLPFVDITAVIVAFVLMDRLCGGNFTCK